MTLVSVTNYMHTRMQQLSIVGPLQPAVVITCVVRLSAMATIKRKYENEVQNLSTILKDRYKAT